MSNFPKDEKRIFKCCKKIEQLRPNYKLFNCLKHNAIQFTTKKIDTRMPPHKPIAFKLIKMYTRLSLQTLKHD